MTEELLCPVCRSVAIPGSKVQTLPLNVSALYFSRTEAQRARRGNVRLAACPSCGMVFNCAYDAAAISYDGSYENSLDNSRVFQEYSEELAARLVSRYALRQRTIIEIGCGNGEFLRRVCTLGGNEGYGFDPSYTGPSHAAERVTIQQRIYGNDIAIPDIALVICRHVLEHIPNPVTFLGELRCALAASDNAVLYFEVPNATAVLTETGLWDVIYPHCSYFSTIPLCRLFEKAGYRVLDCGVAYDKQFLYIEARPTPGTLPFRDQPANRIEVRLDEFAVAVDRAIAEWARFLHSKSKAGAKLSFWGAGAKGTTFLNMVPGAKCIPTVVDINPRKCGAFVPGTGQQIEDASVLASVQPDIVVTLNQMYLQEITTALRSMNLTADLVYAP
jgi:SAM-dependent methyltransferase